MSGVEEILSVPHGVYAKQNVSKGYRMDNERNQRKKVWNTSRVNRAIREGFKDLYKKPKIIQPKMDNWTMLTDPDLHYRMNRKKYDKFFKTGLGIINEHLFGLLGKTVGTAAKNAGDALFDMATDLDQGRSFNNNHLINAAMKTGKNIIFGEASKMKKKFFKDVSDRDYLSLASKNKAYDASRESQFSPPYNIGQVDLDSDYIADLLQYWNDDAPKPAPPAKIGIDWNQAKTGWTPRKTWKDFVPHHGPAMRTRATAPSSLIDLLSTTSESTGHHDDGIGVLAEGEDWSL